MVQDNLDAIFISNTENRRYVSGLESSAGYLLLTQHEAVICTDFRYTEQASLQAPGWRVDRIGGKPDWLANLVNELKIKVLGFEADDLTVETLDHFRTSLKKNNANNNI